MLNMNSFNIQSKECTGEDAELMHNQIESLKSSNKISSWAEAYLYKVCKQGLTTDLWQETVDDMILASKLGVSSEEDFRVFFYIDNFVEDLVEEIFGVALSESEEDELKSYMFGIRDQVGYHDLLSFRVAILKWLKANDKNVKEALWGSTSRNRGSISYFLKKHNLEYWKVLVDLVRKATAYGIPKEVALKEASEQLEGTEKLNFLSWYNFRFGNDKELYDINKKIKENSRGNLAMTKPATKLAGIHEDKLTYYIPHFKEQFGPTNKEEEKTTSLPAYDEQKAKDFNSARSKMISRTFAIDKLLEKYVNILKEEQIEEIEDALNNLRKKVRKLKMANTVSDCFHKTANILEKHDFARGSEMLRLIAEDRSLQKTAITEAHSSDLESMLKKLYGISDALKRRDLVRMLAEIDLQLYNLNIAGFFPELTDAQSKLIDAYAYASNKIQDVIPKLRSGVSQGGGISITMSEDDEDVVTPDSLKPEFQDKSKLKPKINEELSDEVSELARAIEKPIVE